eukprot:6794119-Pyramimonas_sp.AAC.1
MGPLRLHAARLGGLDKHAEGRRCHAIVDHGVRFFGAAQVLMLGGKIIVEAFRGMPDASAARAEKFQPAANAD